MGINGFYLLLCAEESVEDIFKLHLGKQVSSGLADTFPHMQDRVIPQGQWCDGGTWLLQSSLPVMVFVLQ